MNDIKSTSAGRQQHGRGSEVVWSADTTIRESDAHQHQGTGVEEEGDRRAITNPD